jgi:hypothetical protein
MDAMTPGSPDRLAPSPRASGLPCHLARRCDPSARAADCRAERDHRSRPADGQLRHHGEHRESDAREEPAARVASGQEHDSPTARGDCSGSESDRDEPADAEGAQPGDEGRQTGDDEPTAQTVKLVSPSDILWKPFHAPSIDDRRRMMMLHASSMRSSESRRMGPAPTRGEPQALRKQDVADVAVSDRKEGDVGHEKR